MGTEPDTLVRVEIRVSYDVGDDITEVAEIDRAEWEAMDSGQRHQWCVDRAEELRDNVCTSGYTVLGGDTADP